MACSTAAVQARREFAGAVAQHWVAVRDEHPLHVEPCQRLQRWQEALLVPGAATLAVDLEHGVAEG